MFSLNSIDRDFRFINLDRWNFIHETRLNYCIPTTAEMILNYYGEYKWTRDKIYAILSNNSNLTFEGYLNYISPKLRYFETTKQNHIGNIDKLVSFIKSNIDNFNPIFTAVKSDYSKSINYYKRNITHKNHRFYIIFLENSNGQSQSTHIIPVIGYSDNYIIIYELFENCIFGLNYTTDAFRDATQEGNFNTMTIKPMVNKGV